MAVIDKRKANAAKSMSVNMGGGDQTKAPEKMLHQPKSDSPVPASDVNPASVDPSPVQGFDQGQGQGQGQAPPIEQDPEAMQCVDLLRQKGYTADDVERAMGGGEQQEQQPMDDGGGDYGY